MMKSVLFAIVAVACLTRAASAAVVFELEQVSSGPITVGTSADFRVTIRSNAGVISNLSGVDYVIQANDPGFAGNGVAGGKFVSGTNDFFAPNGGFALAFPSSFQVFGANAGSSRTLGTSPTTLTTLSLSTVGATPGTYTMNLGNLLVVDNLFNEIPSVGASPLTYTIAVPEPALATALFPLAGLLLRRRRR